MRLSLRATQDQGDVPTPPECQLGVGPSERSPVRGPSLYRLAGLGHPRHSLASARTARRMETPLGVPARNHLTSPNVLWVSKSSGEIISA